MPSRPIDDSVRFDREAELEPAHLVERGGIEPLPGPTFPREQRAREPYLASAELEDAVNVSIGLGRPLLLQGDPGSGKTKLAYAIAYALGLPLEEAYVKSTSRGQDLLYTYDALRRLHDVQLKQADPDPRAYVSFGALGRAIVRASFGRRSVVLIDEIDKADLDFPNDLLREIDELAFDVPEVPGLSFRIPAVQARLRPIVIITHNEEKALPDAFLRRCIFHYIEFPKSAEMLDRILRLHEIDSADVRSEAIRTVRTLQSVNLVKSPGLSELLDWARYVQYLGLPVEPAPTPHAGALVKLRGDQIRVAGSETPG
jgi:MoxR-like ATPase